MGNVTWLLDMASRRLLTTIADTVECYEDNDHTSIHLRDAAETVTFPINWNAFLYHIQHQLFSTALSRYNTGTWLDEQLSK